MLEKGKSFEELMYQKQPNSVMALDAIFYRSAEKIDSFSFQNARKAIKTIIIN